MRLANELRRSCTLLGAMPYFGEMCALGAAIVWSVAVIFFRRSGETASPFALNLFRVGLSSLMLIVTLFFMRVPLLADKPLSDYLLLALSGVVGIALSDTLYHRCLNITGAGINAIVGCLYSPFVAVLALFLLDEGINGVQISGMALVIFGVLLTTRATPPPGTSDRELMKGILWGFASMATLALGVILARPVLDHGSVLWATAVRQVASFAVMAPLALLAPSRRRLWSVFLPRRDWRFMVPGTVFGSYFALMLWLAGFKYTQAGVAAVLNQTSTVLVLVLAAMFLSEPFTRRRWIAAGFAVAGIMLVTFG